MPIIAIAGAAIAGAIAAPAIGGLIAGTAALTVGSALEITAAVGATLGAVGAVTRDKGLQTAGLVLGSVGAVGSLAGAAGLIDGSTQLFGDASTVAPTAAATAPDLVNTMNGTPAPETLAATNPAGVLANATAATEGQVPGVADTTATDIPTTGAEAVAAGQVPATADQIIQASAPGGLLSNPLATTPIPTNIPVPPVAPSMTSAPSIPPDPSILSKLGSFATSSPLVTYGLIQAGGSLVGGLFSPITPAQVNQMNANAQNYRAQAGLTTTQTQNIQSGVPSVTSVPRTVQSQVTGKPAPITPSGLLNNANPYNQAGAAVTGVPA